MCSLAQEVQHVTGETVKLAFVDQGYTGEEPAEAAKEEGIDLQVVKLPEAKKGFVLLPGAGSSSAASAASTASGDWPGTTSDYQKPWPACSSAYSSS